MKKHKCIIAVIAALSLMLPVCLPVHIRAEEEASQITETASPMPKEDAGVDETDMVIITMMTCDFVSERPLTKEMVDNRIFFPLYDDYFNVVAYYMEFEGAGWNIVHNSKLNPVVWEFGRSSEEPIRLAHDKDPSAKLIYGFFSTYYTEPQRDQDGNIFNNYAYRAQDIAESNEVWRAQIDQYYDAWDSYVKETSKAGQGDEAVSDPSFSEFLVETDLSETDVLIMAHYVLSSDDGSIDFWPEDITERTLVPLYDDAYEVVAYYVSFDKGGYAVVNNNSMNPAILEFGETDSPEIKAILDSNPDARIIYDNPFSVRTKPLDSYQAQFRDIVRRGMKNFHYYNSVFQEPDAELSGILYAARESMGNLRDGNFDHAPSGYISDLRNLNYVSGGSWMTESIYHADSGASTLCSGTVAATNLALIFKRMGYSSVSASTPLQTFYDVAGRTGIFNDWIPVGVDTYFSGVGGYNLDYSYYHSLSSQTAYFNTVKNGINDNKPSIMSVSPDSNNEKWVMGIGWAEATNGNFIRVVNSNTTDDYKFVQVGQETINKVYVYQIEDFNSDAGAFVTRMYNVCLLRDPDSNGFVSWLGVLYNPSYGGGTVARGFFMSDEYINRNRNDAQYLTDLYHALFDREPDTTGYIAWMNILLDNNSAHDRNFVLNGFIDSPEFANLCSDYGVNP